jgi:transposase
MAAKHRCARKVSAAEAARRFGVSERTVRRVMALPREEYEAASLARRRPWEAEGISRATWYRRRAVGAQGRHQGEP